MTPDPRAALRWVFAPATDDVPRGHAVAAVGVRLLLGLLWLYNAGWKVPPNFGSDTSGLQKFTQEAVDHPVFGPYSWVVETIVLPNLAVFGWGVLLVEIALAVLLLTGAYVRLAALIGIAQSVAIGLSVALAPEEWPWSYLLMVGAHAFLLFSSAGRYVAVDAVRADPTSSRQVARSLATVWGVAVTVIGILSALAALGDPLGAQGVGRFTSWQLTLGSYNTLGGLVLAAAGILMLLAARGGSELAARLSMGLAVVAALSLMVQRGFSDPILGGNASTAAVFFSVALVAAYLGFAGVRERTRGVPQGEHSHAS